MPMCAFRSLRRVRSAFRRGSGLLLLLLVVVAYPVAGGENYAEEDRSWHIPPPSGYRAKDYHAPTPDSIPGATVVRTAALREMLAGEKRPFLVDVLSGPAHPTLPGALWLHNGGLGDFDADEEKRFLQVLRRLSGHDEDREIVFFCSGARCWLSYNAALRAVRSGFGTVYWYRGGIDAWRAANLPTRTSDNFQW